MVLIDKNDYYNLLNFIKWNKRFWIIKNIIEQTCIDKLCKFVNNNTKASCEVVYINFQIKNFTHSYLISISKIDTPINLTDDLVGVVRRRKINIEPDENKREKEECKKTV